MTNSTLETSLSPWRVEAWKGTGKGEFDIEERHGGHRALRIQVPAGDGNTAVTVLVWPRYGDNRINLSLESKRTYEFSTWTKWRDRGLPSQAPISLPASVLPTTKSGQTPLDARLVPGVDTG